LHRVVQDAVIETRC